jgi:hypothetical protein
MALLSAWIIGSQLSRQAAASQADLRAPLIIGPVPGAPLEIDGRPPAPAPPPAVPAPKTQPPPAGPPGRIEFDLRSSQSRYLTPEIAFGISQVDEARQRVSAWLRFSSGPGTVWLEDRTALHPIFINSPRDGGTIRIVFTEVAGGRVSGYLLLPSEPNPTARSARPRPEP